MEHDQARSKEVSFEVDKVKPVTVEALQHVIDTIFAVE
jgi:hypothetical protein